MESRLHYIIKGNSRRVGINYGQGEDIWDSIIAFVKQMAEEGKHNDTDTFKSVFINHWGTFYPSMKHINKLKELSDERNKKEDIKISDEEVIQ